MMAKAPFKHIVSTLLFSLCGSMLLANAADNLHLERDFAERFNQVVIENLSGLTEIQTWRNSAIRVAASRKGGSSAATLSSEILFDRSSPETLKIVVQPVARNYLISLIVYVPASINLWVRGGRESVTVKGAVNGLAVETETGNIALYLPADSNADLSLRAIEGTISSMLPIMTFGPVDAHIIDGKIGQGGPPVILRSLRGQINLMPDDASRIAAISNMPRDDFAALRRGAGSADWEDGDPSYSSSRNAGRRGGGRLIDLGARSAPVLGSRSNENSSIGPGRPYDANNREPDGDNVIRLEGRLVNLNVKATDRAGRIVPDLKKEDFLVFEDGVQQEVTHFEPITAPVNLVLLLDLSGSTEGKMKVLKKAARKFIDSLSRGDRIAVAAFTRRFYLISSFTTDYELLKDRIDDIENRHSGTAYYDAMWAALDLFDAVKETRKAIVVLTDGVDNSLSDPWRWSTRHNFDELLMRVAEEDVTIYPIYLDTEYEMVVKRGQDNHEAYAKARKQLEAVADETGGMLFRADRIEDLEGVYQRVASELRTLYSLAYSPYNSQNDGRWRKISVKVNRAGVVARTRRGYYAK